MRLLLLASIFLTVVFSNTPSAFTQQRQASRTALDDIYTFRGAFVQAESLSQYLCEK